jgi:hypothetical protein
MCAEPGRVPAAGCKRPDAGHPVAALAFDRANLGAGSPGQHRPRIAEDRLRDRQVEIGRRHRAAAGLAQAPGGRSIGLRDGFDDMEKRHRIGLDPVGRAWQQQTEQLRIMQLVEEGGRQPARRFDLVGSGRDIGADGFGPCDHRGVARKIGSICDLCVQGRPRLPVRPMRR